MTNKEVQAEVQALIAFYDFHGWNWVNAVGFTLASVGGVCFASMLDLRGEKEMTSKQTLKIMEDNEASAPEMEPTESLPGEFEVTDEKTYKLLVDKEIMFYRNYASNLKQISDLVVTELRRLTILRPATEWAEKDGESLWWAINRNGKPEFMFQCDEPDNMDPVTKRLKPSHYATHEVCGDQYRMATHFTPLPKVRMPEEKR